VSAACKRRDVAVTALQVRRCLCVSSHLRPDTRAVAMMALLTGRLDSNHLARLMMDDRTCEGLLLCHSSGARDPSWQPRRQIIRAFVDSRAIMSTPSHVV